MPTRGTQTAGTVSVGVGLEPALDGGATTRLTSSSSATVARAVRKKCQTGWDCGTRSIAQSSRGAPATERASPKTSARFVLIGSNWP